MNKEIIVNVGERETRIAVLEDHRLVELHVERSERVVGSLYKCRVANVLPGMDASFVDIGLERNAFLYVGDILPQNTDVSVTPRAPRPTAHTARPPRRRDGQPSRVEANETGKHDAPDAGQPEAEPSDDPVAASAGQDITDNFDRSQASAEALQDAGDGVGRDTAPEDQGADGHYSPQSDGHQPALFADDDTAPREGEADPTHPAEDPAADSSSYADTPDMFASDYMTPSVSGSADLGEGTVSASPGLDVDADLHGDDTDDHMSDEDADFSEPGDEDDEEEEESGSAESGRPAGRTRRAGYRRSALRQQRIKDVLKVGQELLVQVIKGPRSTKGARVSTRVSLPGRYLVLMPEADSLGVSRKIEDAKERDRLKRIGDRLLDPGYGLIVRTEAEDKTEQELAQDYDFLMQTWLELVARSKALHAPALVQQDLTLLYKTIRDVFGSDVNRLVIDAPAEFEKAHELLDRISPHLKNRVQLYDGAQPVFDNFGLEAEIDRLMRRKVFLKTGGSLVIDETEALTVIDVNTSKFTGGSNLAETILRTNIDAAGEIARQLRLRDIGGIIVIDFIDMSAQRDRQTVLKAIETALQGDRSRTKLSNISPLGLVEMTRKRTGETLTAFMTETCSHCGGRGHIVSAESISIQIEREIRRAAQLNANAKKDAFLVKCSPEVAELVIGPAGQAIAELERDIERAVFVRAIEGGHPENFTVEAGDVAELDRLRAGFRRAQVIECRVAASLVKETNKCVGWSGGYLLDLDDGSRLVGQMAKVRIKEAHRSFALAEVIPGTAR